MTISDSRASLFGIFKGEIKEQEQERDHSELVVVYAGNLNGLVSLFDYINRHPI